MEETKEPLTRENRPEEKPKKWWHKIDFKWIGIASIVLIAIAIILGFLVLSRHKDKDLQRSNTSATTIGEGAEPESDAIKAGKELSSKQCSGKGVPYMLSQSPMKAEDFGIVVPYGLMVGGHVTPIDHQYFSPKDYNSKPDTYEVRAMADSRIVGISTRPRPFGQEYRMVFTITCTYFYYYDLVTSLSPDIMAAFQDSTSDQSSHKPINIKVKAGQIIGRIGGQTLDFAVWDTTKPLTGFIVPEHYKHENWKIYTADPLKYYTPELKASILSRYARTVAPTSGKIDYDVDGKLIGNWFLEGTNGYEGDQSENGKNYWRTHLSFSPNLYVPDWFVISIGDFVTQRTGEGSQFVTSTNAPNPSNISVESGLVKYDLYQFNYAREGGASWDQNSVPKAISIKPSTAEGSYGCVLVQMIEARKIKFEAVKGTSCASVSGYSGNVKTYTR
jgi:hypothetical protein